jgi:hypothetical protein
MFCFISCLKATGIDKVKVGYFCMLRRGFMIYCHDPQIVGMGFLVSLQI